MFESFESGIFAGTEAAHGHVRWGEAGKKRWQLCFALVQVQTGASWLEKEECQFTLTHHCLFSTDAPFQRPPNDSLVCRPCSVVINQVINRPVSRDIFMSLVLVLEQWCSCIMKRGGWPMASYVEKLPVYLNTYLKGIWMPFARF